jgi:acyl carrier protein
MTARGNPHLKLLADVTAAIRSVLQNPDLELALATSLEDIAGWDSMDRIAVVVELECRFALQFELSEIDTFETVSDLVQALVARKCLAAA